MRLVFIVLLGLGVWWPTLASAEGAGGTYRDIAAMVLDLDVASALLRTL